MTYCSKQHVLTYRRSTIFFNIYGRWQLVMERDKKNAIETRPRPKISYRFGTRLSPKLLKLFGTRISFIETNRDKLFLQPQNINQSFLEKKSHFHSKFSTLFCKNKIILAMLGSRRLLFLLKTESKKITKK